MTSIASTAASAAASTASTASASKPDPVKKEDPKKPASDNKKPAAETTAKPAEPKKAGQNTDPIVNTGNTGAERTTDALVAGTLSTWGYNPAALTQDKQLVPSGGETIKFVDVNGDGTLQEAKEAKVTYHYAKDGSIHTEVSAPKKQSPLSIDVTNKGEHVTLSAFNGKIKKEINKPGELHASQASFAATHFVNTALNPANDQMMKEVKQTLEEMDYNRYNLQPIPANVKQVGAGKDAIQIDEPNSTYYYIDQDGNNKPTEKDVVAILKQASYGSYIATIVPPRGQNNQEIKNVIMPVKDVQKNASADPLTLESEKQGMHPRARMKNTIQEYILSNSGDFNSFNIKSVPSRITTE